MPCLRVHLHALFAVLVLFLQAASAQVGSARLEGAVRDPSGAVVPGAVVSVLNTHTRTQAETSATSEGIFIFPSLQPGFYMLSVEAAGFRKTIVSDLELNTGAKVVQNVDLAIGAITNSIVVRAGAERAQTADAQIAQAVTLRDIDGLPQLGRAPLTLGIYSPGVQTKPGAPFISSSVNGTRQGSSNSRLDGIDVNDSGTPYFGWATTGFNTDSVEEFRIVTSGGKAEYGRNAGGQIELITRSGASTWHGSAFEFMRNTALNANTFFNNSTVPKALERPVFIQNRFGVSVGGPILRDRTFIFGNYQGLRTAQQLSRNRIVLTEEAKRGIFQWKTPGTGALQTFDILAADPRKKGIDPLVAESLNYLPDHNNYGIGDGLNTAGYRFNNLATENQLDGYDDQYTFRIDHNLWRSHRLFFRWTLRRNRNVDNVGPTDARFLGLPYGVADAWGRGFSIGSDWAISTRLVNELRLGYKFYHLNLNRNARLPAPMLLSGIWTDPFDPTFSAQREPPVRHVTDNLTIVRSRHTIKAGAEGRFTNEWKSQDEGIWPNVYFSPNFAKVTIGPSGSDISDKDRATFESLYNALLGRVSHVTQTFHSDFKDLQPEGMPRVRTHRYREYGAFFQDDWKVHPRLTLNLGLRYDFFGAPFEVSGLQGIVDKAALISSTYHAKDITTLQGSHWYDGDWNNFAPRIGIAWDPVGDGRTALRANWGIFYDRLIGATANSVDANTPGLSMQGLMRPNLGGADVRASEIDLWPPRPNQPELSPKNNRLTNLSLFSPTFRTPYVQHYSLTIQREIVRNTVIEGGYVGTHGTKLFMDLNFNQPRIYEDYLGAFRELQKYNKDGTPVSAGNTIVKIYGSNSAAISGIGRNTLELGAVGSAADSMDRGQYPLYVNAGVSDFYLRNYPQFNQVVVGTNDGRSYYNSLQLSLRRQAGALKFLVNYTYSKSMDNITVDGAGFTSPIDNFNVRLNRGRSDFDMPHVLNSTLTYTLPVGKGRRFAAAAPPWVDSLIGGWDIGMLMLWQSGQTITYLSGRSTGPTTGSSFVNYDGDRNIGQVLREGDGVYWLTPGEKGRFSYPDAGEIGTGGRNAFRGPGFFNVDVALVKRFNINERHGILFRAEAYNLLNNVNFGPPNTDFSVPETFGKISSTVGNARILQMALRYEF